MKFAPKRSLQNGPATKWATPKKTTTKRAAPKWSRQKDVLPPLLYYDNFLMIIATSFLANVLITSRSK